MTVNSIDSQLSDLKRQVVAMYRDPARPGVGRAIRLSIQYAIGTGIFLVTAIVTGNPWWSVVVYAVFVTWLAVRLVLARRIVGLMTGTIEKYELRIRELEKKSQDENSA